MKRLLIADNDASARGALCGAAAAIASEWECVRTATGQDALERLADEDFDAALVRLDMPGAGEALLLAELGQTRPELIRIGLAAEEGQIGELAGAAADRFVTVKSLPDGLSRELARAEALKDALSNIDVLSVAVKIESLPALPSSYAQLTREVKSPDASVAKVGEIIARDVGMTAKVLQIINSAYFGLRWHVSSPKEAVSLLGLRAARDLVLSVEVFNLFGTERVGSMPIEPIVEHSLRVAKLAQQVARCDPASWGAVEDAFTAGLLHDTGKLILADRLPELYREAIEGGRANDTSLWEAELEAFGVTHAEIGACLLNLWHLPAGVVEAVAFHHRPELCADGTLGAAGAVHIADALDWGAYAETCPCTPPTLSQELVDATGLAPHVAKLREGLSATGATA